MAVMNGFSLKKTLKPQSLALGLLCSVVTTVAFSEISVNNSSFQIEQIIDKNILEGLNREVNIFESPAGSARSFGQLERYDEKLPLNDIQEAYQLEEQYRSGVEPSLSEINKLSSEAMNGDKIAQFNLGSLYENGRGVDQNYKKALENYKLAADQGDILSMLRLGNIYDSGIGIKQDKERADLYYRESLINIDNKISEFFDTPNLEYDPQNEASFLGLMESIGIIAKSIQAIPKILNYISPRYYVTEGEAFFKPKIVDRNFEKAFRNYNLAMKDRAFKIGINLDYDEPINVLVNGNNFDMSIIDAVENRAKVKLWFHEACSNHQDKVSCSLLKIMDASDRYIKTTQFEFKDNRAKDLPQIVSTPTLNPTFNPNETLRLPSDKPNTDLHVDTIKSLYSDAFSNFQKTGDSSHYDAKILYKYANEYLKDAIFLAQNTSIVNENKQETECRKAAKRLRLLNINDSVIEDALDFRKLRNDDVRVLTAFESDNRFKEYSLQCTGNSCEIADVFDQYGVSAIESIVKACQ